MTPKEMSDILSDNLSKADLMLNGYKNGKEAKRTKDPRYVETYTRKFTDESIVENDVIPPYIISIHFYKNEGKDVMIVEMELESSYMGVEPCHIIITDGEKYSLETIERMAESMQDGFRMEMPEEDNG